MKDVWVYVAGPLTQLDNPLHGVRTAIETAAKLEYRAPGIFAEVPHLSVLWDMHCPKLYEDWMERCFAQIRRCDALLRLNGTSPGSDREVNYAKELGLPVFTNIDDVIDWDRKRKVKAC